jgi:hypothetical protein
VLLDDAISRQFSEYVNGLPWAGTTGLDWARLPSVASIDISSASAGELADWIRRVRLGRHTHAAVWYGEPPGGIVVPVPSISVALDELFQHSAGVRFVFGIDEEGVNPDFSSIVQWGLGDVLFAADS